MFSVFKTYVIQQCKKEIKSLLPSHVSHWVDPGTVFKLLSQLGEVGVHVRVQTRTVQENRQFLLSTKTLVGRDVFEAQILKQIIRGTSQTLSHNLKSIHRHPPSVLPWQIKVWQMVVRKQKRLCQEGWMYPQWDYTVSQTSSVCA